MYNNKAKTMRLTIGIISIVLSAFILFQSCAAGAVNAITENGESGGSGGMFVSILMLASGIVSIAARKTKGGTITALCMYLLGAIIGFATAGSVYKDLYIWATLAVVFAVLLLISLKLKAKN